MTYEHHVNFAALGSRLERQGVEAQIRNFGQCPSQRTMPQWFREQPHPQRRVRKVVLEGESGADGEAAVY